MSQDVLPSIYNGTDLVALDLGAEPTEGYRIYYKDAELRTAALRYDQAGGWAYDGFVTQDNSSMTGIGAALTSATDIMVVVGLVGADESGDLLNGIEYCTTNSDGSWSISKPDSDSLLSRGAGQPCLVHLLTSDRQHYVPSYRLQQR